VSLDQEVAAPQCYPAGPFSLGQQTGISVTAAQGLCAIGIAAALAPQPIATPLGALLLDPQTAAIQFAGVAGAEQRFDAQLAVPVDPYFVGVEFAAQGLGLDRTGVLRLGNGWRAVVQQ
jgi:hypothetical protein